MWRSVVCTGDTAIHNYFNTIARENISILPLGKYFNVQKEKFNFMSRIKLNFDDKHRAQRGYRIMEVL